MLKHGSNEIPILTPRFTAAHVREELLPQLDTRYRQRLNRRRLHLRAIEQTICDKTIRRLLNNDHGNAIPEPTTSFNFQKVMEEVEAYDRYEQEVERLAERALEYEARAREAWNEVAHIRNSQTNIVRRMMDHGLYKGLEQARQAFDNGSELYPILID